MTMKVAALYVDPLGPYDRPARSSEPWTEERDAWTYDGYWRSTRCRC